MDTPRIPPLASVPEECTCPKCDSPVEVRDITDTITDTRAPSRFTVWQAICPKCGPINGAPKTKEEEVECANF